MNFWIVLLGVGVAIVLVGLALLYAYVAYILK